MKLLPTDPLTGRQLVEIGAFIVVVALFAVVGSTAGMRGVGVMAVVGAIEHLIDRRVAYGWEGHERSGHIIGLPAMLLSLVNF